VDLWAQIVIPLITLAGGWFGNSWRYRRERLDKLTDLRQKAEELHEDRCRWEMDLESRREERDRELIEKAAALCRSEDAQERQHGQAFLVGLAAMGSENPRVAEVLDQLTQLELGQTVEDIRQAKAEGASTIEIVEEVVVSDVIRPADDDGEGGLPDRGSVEAQEAGPHQDHQGDASAGADRPRSGDG
jgi:hypothetical protein